MIQRYAQFWFFRNGSANSFSTTFCVLLFKKKCSSCYILLTDQMPLADCILLLEILGNICIAMVCFPGCDIINFEINLIFLIKLFFYLTKMSRQKFKYLEIEKSFLDEIFIIFKELSVAKNCLGPDSAPLRHSQNFWRHCTALKQILQFSANCNKKCF